MNRLSNLSTYSGQSSYDDWNLKIGKILSSTEVFISKSETILFITIKELFSSFHSALD